MGEGRAAAGQHPQHRQQLLFIESWSFRQALTGRLRVPGAVPRAAETTSIFPALSEFPLGGTCSGPGSSHFRKKTLRTERERVKDGGGVLGES